MEHCITKIGTEVDFCQVAFFVRSWEKIPLSFQKDILGSKHVISQNFSGSPRYSLLLQEWPKCLLQPCRGSQRPNSITNAMFNLFMWQIHKYNLGGNLSSQYQGGGNLDSAEGWTSNCNRDGIYSQLFKQHQCELQGVPKKMSFSKFFVIAASAAWIYDNNSNSNLTKQMKTGI